jgi:hypothetical protein
MLHCTASSVFVGMKLSILLIFVPFSPGISPGVLPGDLRNAIQAYLGEIERDVFC